MNGFEKIEAYECLECGAVYFISRLAKNCCTDKICATEGCNNEERLGCNFCDDCLNTESERAQDIAIESEELRRKYFENE